MPLHTVALTRSFLTDCRVEGLSEAEVAAIVDVLAQNPAAGALIVGSGGARKVRIARPDGGKSGGYRLITAFVGEELPVYALALFSKGEKGNLSKREVNDLAKVLAQLKGK